MREGEDKVRIYVFPSGHQIFRLTSQPAFRGFIGAPEMPDGVAGFLLTTGREIPLSAMWMHTGEGKLSGEIKNPIGGSKMGWPRHWSWAPYWRDFVEQTMSEDYADKNFALPVVIPDGLEHALNLTEEEETEHRRLVENYDLGSTSREKAVKDHMSTVLKKIFNPFSPFRNHIRFSRAISEVGPSRVDQLQLQFLKTPNDEEYRFALSIGDGWYFIKERTDRRPVFTAEGETLIQAWRKLAEASEADLRPFVPESLLEAWWNSQRFEGEPVFDLEPYFLLETTSPMLFDNSSFILWAEQQSQTGAG